MQFKGQLNDYILTINNEAILQIKVNVNDIIIDELNSFKTAKNGLKIEIKKYRENRSLNANAYFHLLVHKIAEKINIGNDECKIRMNLEYGTPKMLDEKTLFAIQVPKGANIREIYHYSKWVKEIIDNGITKDVYILYKETHTLNTKEMSRLIDGVVYECKQLGIETMTPSQIADMISLWRQYNG